jgi:hypothetical protein
MEQKFCNRIGYSDVTPFEIVRVISDKTIEIREMDAERDFQPEFIPGGFAGHCTNNSENEQKWIIKSNPENPIIRCRLQKNGQWKSAYGRHTIDDKPRKFYDYNF